LFLPPFQLHCYFLSPVSCCSELSDVNTFLGDEAHED
jgi:hypothetical protein